MLYIITNKLNLSSRLLHFFNSWTISGPGNSHFAILPIIFLRLFITLYIFYCFLTSISLSYSLLTDPKYCSKAFFNSSASDFFYHIFVLPDSLLHKITFDLWNILLYLYKSILPCYLPTIAAIAATFFINFLLYIYIYIYIYILVGARPLRGRNTPSPLSSPSAVNSNS